MRRLKVLAVPVLLAALAGCSGPLVVKSIGPVNQEWGSARVTCWDPKNPGDELTVTWEVLAEKAPVVGEPWDCN